MWVVEELYVFVEVAVPCSLRSRVFVVAMFHLAMGPVVFYINIQITKDCEERGINI